MCTVASVSVYTCLYKFLVLKGLYIANWIIGMQRCILKHIRDAGIGVTHDKCAN